MKLSDYNIVYLNLDRRVDRRENIERELDKNNLLDTAKRISAVDGQQLTDSEFKHHMTYFNVHRFSKREDRIKGKIGCYLSHLEVLEYAISNNFSNILIFEDDCEFNGDISNVEITPPTNCDIFYLGGFFWRNKEEERLQEGDWINIKRPYFKIACTFAYGIIGKDKINYIYNTIKNSKAEAIDLMYIKNIQRHNNCYIINPVICKQNHSFSSDVTNIGNKTPKYVNSDKAYVYN